jgi:(p)ppGpp synthase/HD superfamily hydrolase
MPSFTIKFSPRGQGAVDAALSYACRAHQNQVRKYTGEPYITHCVAVAQRVADLGGGVETVMAAVLHDTIEDTATTYQDIKSRFWVSVANLVWELSDVSRPGDGNRAYRKMLDTLWLQRASFDAKFIKLADLLDNGQSILENDQKFWKVYRQEMLAKLPVLAYPDARYAMVEDPLREGYLGMLSELKKLVAEE